MLSHLPNERQKETLPFLLNPADDASIAPAAIGVAILFNEGFEGAAICRFPARYAVTLVTELLDSLITGLRTARR
jgi:hypothetical protein